MSEQLICPSCDVFNLKGKHFGHQFTYILPFFFNNQARVVYNAHSKMQKSIANMKSFLENCIQQLDIILD